MFVRLRVQGFESSVNKVFRKAKLVNSKTIRFTVLIEGVCSAGAKVWFTSCILGFGDSDSIKSFVSLPP
jgi:hypothetical protein